MNTLFDLNDNDFSNLFDNLGTVEVELKESTEELELFNSNSLYAICAQIMGIDVVAWRQLVDGRGMKPVKAAIRCGSEVNLAQLVGDLRLAYKARDIDHVYADTRCGSCMTGYKVGKFWAANQVGVIYAPNFRVLVGLKTRGLNPSAYGYKGAKVLELLKPFFNVKESPTPSKYTWETTEVFVGREKSIRRKYIAYSIESDDISVITSPHMLEVLVKHGIKERSETNGYLFSFVNSKHRLPEPLKGSFSLKPKSYRGPKSDQDFLDAMPRYFNFKDCEGYHKVYHDTILVISDEVVDIPKFEYKDIVIKQPDIKYSKDLSGDEVPFIDFDFEVLSEEDGIQKIKELNLILNSKNEEALEESNSQVLPLSRSDMAELTQMSLEFQGLAIETFPF